MIHNDFLYVFGLNQARTISFTRDTFKWKFSSISLENHIVAYAPKLNCGFPESDSFEKYES